MVEKSLESLEGDLRIHGNRMLMQHIRSNWSTFQDRNSFNRLLHVAQDFVTRLIDSKTHVLAADTSASARFSQTFYIVKITLDSTVFRLNRPL